MTEFIRVGTWPDAVQYELTYRGTKHNVVLRHRGIAPEIAVTPHGAAITYYPLGSRDDYLDFIEAYDAELLAELEKLLAIFRLA